MAHAKSSSAKLLTVIITCLVMSSAQAIPDWLQNLINIFNGASTNNCQRLPTDVTGDIARRREWEDTSFKLSLSNRFKDKDVGPAYNVFTQTCCQGKVHSLIPNTPIRCCGDKTYDASTHMCCSGVVNELYPGKTCCGTTTIDSKKQVCCDGCVVEYPKASDPDVRRNIYCCGGKPYDNRTQICCSTSVNERPSKNAGCCGSTAYDLDNEVCCSLFTTFVVKREGKISADNCCGSKVYDSRTESCCYGTTVYNSSTTGCCNGKLYESNTMGCCDDELFDLKTQSCCSGKIYNSAASDDLDCCQEVQYNKKEKICCFGKVYDNLGAQRECCVNFTEGTAMTYDPVTEKCCSVSLRYNKVFLKNHPADTKCCGSRTYNKANELCCKGSETVVQKRSKLDTSCCAGEPYNTNAEICCSDGKTERKYDKKASDFDGCCGKTPFSSTTHMCCGNQHIVDLNSNSACCNGQLYDTTTHVCCEDPVFKTSTLVRGAFPEAVCCGRQLYSIGNGSKCCGSTLYRESSFPADAMCCGEAIYSPKSQLCCAEDVVRPKVNGPSECCYNFLTDGYTAPPQWPTNYQPQDLPSMLLPM